MDLEKGYFWRLYVYFRGMGHIGIYMFDSPYDAVKQLRRWRDENYTANLMVYHIDEDQWLHCNGDGVVDGSAHLYTPARTIDYELERGTPIKVYNHCHN